MLNYNTFKKYLVKYLYRFVWKVFLYAFLSSKEESCRPKYWTYNLDSPPSTDLTTNGRVDSFYQLELLIFKILLLEAVVLFVQMAPSK